jgi:hypothetical protein
MKNLTEDEFYEKFTPIKNHLDDNASFDGCMFETFNEEMEYVRKMAEENRVVTIIEGEDEINDDGEPSACMFYSSGLHLVNRIGFLVLDKPYSEDFEVRLSW